MDIVDKVKQAAIKRYKQLGYSTATSEQLYDVYMDKLALTLPTPKAPKAIGVVANQSNVGPGNGRIAGLSSCYLQAEAFRQKINAKKETNIPVQPRNKVASVDEHGLQICKASFVCGMSKIGVAPLMALKIFDEKLEKYADAILDSYVPETSKLQRFTNIFKPVTQQARSNKNYSRFMQRMIDTGAAGSQGIGGFTPTDEVSRRRINAVINGLISVPMTGGTMAVEGIKKLLR